MIHRPLDELLGRLRARVERDVERTDVAREIRSNALVMKLPLVHRTAPAEKPDTWRAILKSGTIRAGAPHTEREKRLGSKRTAYFFFGHPAWPSGLAAFVLAPHNDVLGHATFTPFDSGGLTKHMAAIEPAVTLDDSMKEELLASHVGAGDDLREFASAFIATHVRTPDAYVSRPQVSQPDWPAFHGLRSITGDRRSWTIELQVHGDVSLDPPEERIAALILGGRDNGIDIDDDVFGLCTLVETEDDVPTAVVNHILTRAMEPDA